jgi:hypothetical protein
MSFTASSSSVAWAQCGRARVLVVGILLIPVILITLFAVGCASPCPTLNTDGGVTTYEVTGTVLELTASRIVIEKGTSRWELVRTPSLRITGELTVGARVTITYLLVGVKSELHSPAVRQ